MKISMALIAKHSATVTETAFVIKRLARAFARTDLLGRNAKIVNTIIYLFLGFILKYVLILKFSMQSGNIWPELQPNFSKMSTFNFW